MELEGLRSDSASFPIEVGLHPTTLEGETLTLASTVDVTHRRHLASRLTQLSQAVEQSPECVSVTDIHGRVVFGNQSCVRLMGGGAISVQGCDLAELLRQRPGVLKRP